MTALCPITSTNPAPKKLLLISTASLGKSLMETPTEESCWFVSVVAPIDKWPLKDLKYEEPPCLRQYPLPSLVPQAEYYTVQVYWKAGQILEKIASSSTNLVTEQAMQAWPKKVKLGVINAQFWMTRILSALFKVVVCTHQAVFTIKLQFQILNWTGCISLLAESWNAKPCKICCKLLFSLLFFVN